MSDPEIVSIEFRSLEDRKWLLLIILDSSGTFCFSLWSLDHQSCQDTAVLLSNS